MKVKVLVLTVFDKETGPWLQNEHLGRAFTVPAMADAMHCGIDGLRVATIGEGKTNAAASMSAILADNRLDLTSAYLMTSGIAPTTGTLGDAGWADWVVDYEIGHTFPMRPTPLSPWFRW